MIVRITKLERGTRQTKAGSTQAGLYVYGVKIDQNGNDEKNWEKFLPEQFNADQISQFESVGVGNTANVKMVKNGNFWNVGNVELDEPNSSGGTGGSAPASSGGGSRPASSGKKSDNYRKPEEIIRVNALTSAVNLTGKMIDLNAQEKTKLYNTKTSTDLLVSDVLDLAAKFEAYIRGEKDAPVTESDSSDVKKPVDAEEPEIPGDDQEKF